MPILGYLGVGALFAWNYRFHLNSDASVYLDMARLFAESRYPDALVGYWGPLLPLVIAPLLVAGLAPLAAGHVVAFLLGALWIGVLQWFLRSRMPRPSADFLAFAGGVPLAMTVGIPFSVLPDALLSMVIMVLCWVIYRDASKATAGGALAAGALCGAAYLCKSPAWVLCLPATLLCIAGTRRPWSGRESGVRVRHFAHLALVIVGFACVAGPWIAALAWRTGRLTMGSSTAALLATNYLGRGFDAPEVRFWIPYDGERWLRHNPWAVEPVGPVPIQWRFHFERILSNWKELSWFGLSCPMAAVGLWSLIARSRRSMASRRHAVAWWFSATMLSILLSMSLERRYLLYMAPLLLVAAGRSPTFRWLGTRPLRRSRLLLAATCIAALPVIRYWPVRELGRERYEGCEIVRSGLAGGERTWFNEMPAGLPVAFLLDRKLALESPMARPSDDQSDRDLVIWSESGGEGVGPSPRIPPDLVLVHEWTEEDGRQVRILRRRP